MSQVAMDKRVEASIDRLKAMGLKLYVERISPDECYIVIDMNSFVGIVDKKITYPSRELYLEGMHLMVRFWRGGKPV